MAHPGLLDPRLVKVRAGRRGSGWAVGTCGVLTARHVLRAFLAGEVDRCVVAVDPTPDAPVFDCEVLWQDLDRDLAVLRVIGEPQRAAWAALAGRAGPTVLAEPGSRAVAATAVGYPDAALHEGTRAPQPELAPGTLLPAQGVMSGQMPFDVESSVPETHLLWQGMSGAALSDDHQRVLGVVTEVDNRHQLRRLYVAVLPDPRLDASFRAALEAVGAPPVVEAADAPQTRRLLSLCDATGRPFLARAVPELGELGTRRSRTDIDTGGNRYYPYVPRKRIDSLIADALDRRVAGVDRRALVILGDAMTGKTRTLAESVRAHPLISGWQLLKPKVAADLQDVIRTFAGVGGVVWLDNVYSSYSANSASLEAALRSLRDTTNLVVLGTVRTDEMRRLETNADMRSAWDTLSDDECVEMIELDAEWGPADRAALSSAEPLIRDALARGEPLGQVLGAATKLASRLRFGSVEARALVSVIADWQRAGMPTAMEEALARRLWLSYLPSSRATALRESSKAVRKQTMRDALNWACAPVAGTASLVRRADHGLRAEDYVVSRRAGDELAIRQELWSAALRAATQRASDPGDSTLFAVGNRAYEAGNIDVAVSAWSGVSSERTARGYMSAFNLGSALAERGDRVGARAAYQRIIDSGAAMVGPSNAAAREVFNRFVGARAKIRLASLIAEDGDIDAAIRLYEEAIADGPPSEAVNAAAKLGALYVENERHDDARTVFRHLADRGPASSTNPELWLQIGIMLRDLHELPAAAKALGAGLGSGADPDIVESAALELGEVLYALGRHDEAMQALRAVPENSTRRGRASLIIGLILVKQGRPGEAEGAFRESVAADDPDHSPRAAYELGKLLEGRKDNVGAIRAYSYSRASGHRIYAPSAAFQVGMLKMNRRDRADAEAAFNEVLQYDLSDSMAGVKMMAEYGLEKLDWFIESEPDE